MTQTTDAKAPDAGPARGPAANDNRPRVEIYHKTWCPYSRDALALLDQKGVAYEALDVTDDRALEAEMVERAGRTSVPQVFVDGERVGGYVDLVALDERGLLDGLIGAAPRARPDAA